MCVCVSVFGQNLDNKVNIRLHLLDAALLVCYAGCLLIMATLKGWRGAVYSVEWLSSFWEN